MYGLRSNIHTEWVAGMAEYPTEAIGYLRVSTAGQGASGLGLKAQRSAIRKAAEARGWRVTEWIEDRASGRTLDRPGIQRALSLLEGDGPEVLVAAKLDRLARSGLDFLGLAARARDHGWALVVLDVDMDMTTRTGRFVAGILALVAELERDLIAERTREALAEAKARGVKLGRPRQLPDEVAVRIRGLRAEGMSLRAIADRLNADGVPTAQDGRQWYASTVRAVLNRDQG